jgi:hypothetical protein
MHPKGPHDGQDEGEARRDQAQDLVSKAHGLSRGQSRIPQLENTVAGGKRLLKAAILRNQILIKIIFSLF